MLNTKVLKTWRNRQKVIDLRTTGGRYFGYKTRPPLLPSARDALKHHNAVKFGILFDKKLISSIKPFTFGALDLGSPNSGDPSL